MNLYCRHCPQDPLKLCLVVDCSRGGSGERMTKVAQWLSLLAPHPQYWWPPRDVLESWQAAEVR